MKKNTLILYTFFLLHNSCIYSMELSQLIKKNIITKYLCEICGRDCTNLAGLISHNRIHNPEPFICYACDNKFKFKYNLIEHIKQQHPNNKKTFSSPPKKLYQCNICDNFSLTKNCCKKPIKRHEENLKKHSCDMCGRKYKQRPHLLRHKKSHFVPQINLESLANFEAFFGPQDILDQFNTNNNLQLNDPLLCFNIQ